MCVSSDGLLTYWFASTTASRLDVLSGPVAGGTRVLVDGTHFGHLAALSCMVAGRIVPALWLLPSKIECRTPPGVIGTHTLVAISDGWPVGGMDFDYYAPVGVLSEPP